MTASRPERALRAQSLFSASGPQVSVVRRQRYGQAVTNEKRVRDFWRRVWSEGDVAYAHEFFAPTYRENDRERTPDGHARGATAFREYFPDFRTEVIGLMDFGDVVVSRVVFRGTYAGGWAGVDSVGTATEVSGVDLFQFKDGLVVDHWHEADHELMWEQLGVPLPPG